MYRSSRSDWWKGSSTRSDVSPAGAISSDERKRVLERDLNRAKEKVSEVSGGGHPLLPFLMMSVFTLTAMAGGWLADCMITVIREGWPIDE